MAEHSGAHGGPRIHTMRSSRPWTAASLQNQTSPPRGGCVLCGMLVTDVGKATIAGLVVELAKGTIRL